MKIFHWILNASIVNGWLFYSRDYKAHNLDPKKKLDLLEFSMIIGKNYLTNSRVTEIGNSLERDNIQEHKIRKVPRNKRGRCALCKAFTPVKCEKCDKFFCLLEKRNCYSNHAVL